MKKIHFYQEEDVAGVFDERLIWTAVPEKYEAGTQKLLRCNSYGEGAC